MTDYTATPEQWTDVEYYGNPERQPHPIGECACILELRARIEALEVVHIKPSSLKEQALALLDKAEDPSWDINDFSIVRKALEQLPND